VDGRAGISTPVRPNSCQTRRAQTDYRTHVTIEGLVFMRPVATEIALMGITKGTLLDIFAHLDHIISKCWTRDDLRQSRTFATTAHAYDRITVLAHLIAKGLRSSTRHSGREGRALKAKTRLHCEGGHSLPGAKFLWQRS